MPLLAVRHVSPLPIGMVVCIFKLGISLSNIPGIRWSGLGAYRSGIQFWGKMFIAGFCCWVFPAVHRRSRETQKPVAGNLRLLSQRDIFRQLSLKEQIGLITEQHDTQRVLFSAVSVSFLDWPLEDPLPTFFYRRPQTGAVQMHKENQRSGENAVSRWPPPNKRRRTRAGSRRGRPVASFRYGQAGRLSRQVERCGTCRQENLVSNL